MIYRYRKDQHVYYTIKRTGVQQTSNLLKKKEEKSSFYLLSRLLYSLSLNDIYMLLFSQVWNKERIEIWLPVIFCVDKWHARSNTVISGTSYQRDQKHKAKITSNVYLPDEVALSGCENKRKPSSPVVFQSVKLDPAPRIHNLRKGSRPDTGLTVSISGASHEQPMCSEILQAYPPLLKEQE